MTIKLLNIARKGYLLNYLLISIYLVRIAYCDHFYCDSTFLLNYFCELDFILTNSSDIKLDSFLVIKDNLNKYFAIFFPFELNIFSGFYSNSNLYSHFFGQKLGISEDLKEFKPKVYYPMNSNTGGEGSSRVAISNLINPVDAPSYYPMDYTFTSEDIKKLQSLDNDKIIREFKPDFMRKFSETLIEEDFDKHLNSPTNRKFHNALGNNIKTRLNLVLGCYDNNYEEAINDINRTLHDPKGRVCYKEKWMQFRNARKNPHLLRQL